VTPALLIERGPRAACAFASRFALATLALLLSLASAPADARQSTVGPDSFVALSYHEIDDDLNPRDGNAIGRYGMESSALVAQFAWLRDNGYTPVSLSAVIEARNGGRPLPAKSILLTFDDGYASFYHRVFPVLRLFGYPAVIALVGTWMDTPEGRDIDYEGHPVPRDAFLTWPQVREMVRSGLVEVASHSYDLHHGVPGNPQGNLLPAATTRIHDAATGRYEDDAAYEARIRADLARSRAQIERETGRPPRAVVWPYGRYNGTTQAIARGLGMPVMMTVESGINTPDVPVDAVHRSIVQFSPDLNAFVDEIETVWPADPRRVVHVDLDRLHDALPEERERRLSQLIDRIAEIRPNTVFLKAWSDTDGDGRADHLYFPNRHLPVRSDLFNRVAWQLATRAEVSVYAALPVAAFGPGTDPAPESTVTGIYEDLARHAYFSGIVFQEPDTHPAPDSDAYVASTRALLERARMHRAPLRSARAFAADGMSPDALAALVARRGRDYDYLSLRVTADGAPPGTGARTSAVDALARAVAVGGVLGGADAHKVIVEIAAPGASPSGFGSGTSLARLLRRLELEGARSLAFAPDDPAADQPPRRQVIPPFSLRALPLR